MNRKTIIISAAVVGGLLVTGLILYPVVMRSNIRKRLEEAYKNKDNVAGGLDKYQVTEAFDTRSYDTLKSKATISLIEARERAAQVWDNYSWYSTNQTAIVAAFNGLGHIADVSKISHEFQARYNEELLSVLKNTLSDSAQFNILISKLDKLPKK